MAEINETAIVKFLATEVLDGVPFISPNNDEGDEYWQFKTPNGKTPFTCIRVDAFDPMNDIAHAFMVEDAIAKMGYNIKRKYAVRIDAEVSVLSQLPSEFNLIHASPKQRTIAAARALAGDEQIREFGL